MIGWITPVISALSALVGGFAGGWLVAYRMGRWRQAVEDRLGVVEERLQKGDPLVETVPLIRTRLDLVVEEIRAMRKEIREDRSEERRVGKEC